MEITSLKLINFRNFSNLELNFSKNRNLIIGNNGEGKTNIVEAIFVLALTKSFRTNEDDILIKENNNLYKIEGNIKSSFINNYKIIYQDKVKVVKINNNKINKLSDYISNIQVVFFSINDLKLIKDTPNTRRKLINLEISQLNNNYIKYLNYYNKILKQRNTYLKSTFNINKSYLNILDEQLIDYGLKIFNMRKKFINNINDIISNIYNKLGGKGKLFIKYKSDYDDLDKEEILKIYNKYIDKDLNLKSTQYGIHKDDYIFYIDDKDIKNFGSEGQQKNSVIAFKMAELEIFNDTNNDYPILILDDLFSELDIKKIECILDYINRDIQTFITTTDLKKVKNKYLKNSKVFQIKNGEIREDFYE
ncbi:MAG: DNA replication/repair protein RecF [Bacilli bacterium]|nr:DNA replication/repair protein RecF [Bacilli bacterium]